MTSCKDIGEAATDVSKEATILLVDDEKKLLSVNQKLLSALGNEVRTADSGMVALEILKEWNADLVVLDMVMPEMNGVTTLRKIREFKPDQKVIILSAYSDPAQIRMAERLGAIAYVEKPASLNILSGIISDTLKGMRPASFRINS